MQGSVHGGLQRQVTMTPLRISGKNLGALQLAGFCPRCFWLRLHCENKIPFQIFPGIFSSIDAYSKRITAAHFARHGKAPAWFAELGDIVEIVPSPHHSKFQWLDPATGIVLSGAMDDVVRLRNESLVILDYKTGRHTAGQDALAPMYRVQLNAYALIAEKTGMGRVSGLALIYYEPQTSVGADDVDSVVGPDGFAMRFNAKVLPVALEPETIPPLLARVREIYDLPFPPTGRAGCKDCRSLEELLALSNNQLSLEEQWQLKVKLLDLEDELFLIYFQDGMSFDTPQAHRSGLPEIKKQTAKRDAERHRIRLAMEAVERQLRWGAGGKVSG